MKTKSQPRAPKPEPPQAPILQQMDAQLANDLDGISRLSFPVDSDGRVQWDSMRQSTKEKVRSILQNPETARVLGIESQGSSSPVEVFDPAWTGSIYDAIGKLESFGVQKIYGMPAHIAEKCFLYTDAEKEKLAAPTAKVINKYATVWMVKFKDEIALAFLFVTMTAVKLQMASTLMQMEKRMEEAKTARPSAPAPTPKDIDPATMEKSLNKEEPPRAA